MNHATRHQWHAPTEAEKAARQARNRALGAALLGLAVLFWLTTMAKLGLHLPGL